MSVGMRLHRPEGSGYRCEKAQREVPADAVECPEPDSPCKYRSECMVFALWLEGTSRDRQGCAGSRRDQN